MSIPEVRIKARAQNNLLLTMIEKEYHSIKEFCIKNNLPYSSVYSVVNLAIDYKNSTGGYRKVCIDIATAFKVLPDMIFPDSFDLIEKNRIEKTVCISDLSLEESNAILLPSPEDVAIRNEKIKTIRDVLTMLEARDQEVIRLRYGIDCEPHTLKEIGELMNISFNRVRQIEHRALGRMRNPKIRKKLEAVI